jgi:UDP-hydrolysing UDP-N-acetyl-D-glucosamine 2-epimerase
MIGDGWDDIAASRPGLPDDPASRSRRRVLAITGSRAEFGLLEPVMRAIIAHPKLELAVAAAGSHLLQPELTVREVKARFRDHLVDLVPMQNPGHNTRDDDVQALSRGVAKLGRTLAAMQPDWTLVLGDRIEALAGALAASISGRALAHIHGGDRAEGVADEAMRHAISKLAHLHLAATPQSAERLRRMGEPERFVHAVGSPAIDGLDAIPPLDDARFAELGSPGAVVLMHPIGRPAEHEESAATAALEALLSRVPGSVLALDPNHDAGREGVLRALDQAASREPNRVIRRAHLPRERFVGLLKRLHASALGVLVGNSSAALIEAAALRVPAVDIGSRQSGRERAGNVVTSLFESRDHIASAIDAALRLDRRALTHSYGDGSSGPRIAGLLAATDPHDARMLRKRCAY